MANPDRQAIDEHERDRQTCETMLGYCAEMRSGNPSAATIQTLKDMLPSFTEHVIDHIRTEEVYMNPLLVKFGSYQFQKKTAIRIWHHSPLDVWSRIIPFVIRNARFHEERLRFLLALQLFVPEYMQRIGGWIYLNVPNEIYEKLHVDLPDIVPRGIYPYGLIRYL